MRLYQVYCTPLATKFYLVADDVPEIEGLEAEALRGDWLDRSRRFRQAICHVLGVADENWRFVRANYESDGIWVAKLFGPANDALQSWLWEAIGRALPLVRDDAHELPLLIDQLPLLCEPIVAAMKAGGGA